MPLNKKYFQNKGEGQKAELHQAVHMSWLRSSMPHFFTAASLRESNPEAYENAVKVIQLRPDVNALLEKRRKREQEEGEIQRIKKNQITCSKVEAIPPNDVLSPSDELEAEKKENKEENGHESCHQSENESEQEINSPLTPASNNESLECAEKGGQENLCKKEEVDGVNKEEEVKEESISTPSEYFSPEQNTFLEYKEETSHRVEECDHAEEEAQYEAPEHREHISEEAKHTKTSLQESGYLGGTSFEGESCDSSIDEVPAPEEITDVLTSTPEESFKTIQEETLDDPRERSEAINTNYENDNKEEVNSVAAEFELFPIQKEKDITWDHLMACGSEDYEKKNNEMEQDVEEILSVPVGENSPHPGKTCSSLTTLDDGSLSYSEGEESNLQWIPDDDIWDDYCWQAEKNILEKKAIGGSTNRSNYSKEKDKTADLDGDCSEFTEIEDIFKVTLDSQSGLTSSRNTTGYSIENLLEFEKALEKSVRELFEDETEPPQEWQTKDDPAFNPGVKPDEANIIEKIRNTVDEQGDKLPYPRTEIREIGTQTPEKRVDANGMNEMGDCKVPNLKEVGVQSPEEGEGTASGMVPPALERTNTFIPSGDETKMFEANREGSYTVIRKARKELIVGERENKSSSSLDMKSNRNQSKKQTDPRTPLKTAFTATPKSKSVRKELFSGKEDTRAAERLPSRTLFPITPKRTVDMKPIKAKNDEKVESLNKTKCSPKSEPIRQRGYVDKTIDDKNFIRGGPFGDSLTPHRKVEQVTKRESRSTREGTQSPAVNKSMARNVGTTKSLLDDGSFKTRNDVTKSARERKSENSDISAKSSLRGSTGTLSQEEGYNLKPKVMSPIKRVAETSSAQKLRLDKTDEKGDVSGQNLSRTPSRNDQKKMKSAKTAPSRRWNY